ncbi:hypothetical protein H3268_24035, partial [Escherichia coli]
IGGSTLLTCLISLGLDVMYGACGYAMPGSYCPYGVTSGKVCEYGATVYGRTLTPSVYTAC